MGERGGIRFNPVAVRSTCVAEVVISKCASLCIATWRHRVYYWIDIGSGVNWHGDLVHINNFTREPGYV